ncbi:hypothetical protein L1049_006631 [Liquidambar formosana]|uniref:Uncharacterized protein n=1 Tax=Liquidambar formosana TaxID=63359 RepID=A0AAP0RFX0_LIQFO
MKLLKRVYAAESGHTHRFRHTRSREEGEVRDTHTLARINKRFRSHCRSRLRSVLVVAQERLWFWAFKEGGCSFLRISFVPFQAEKPLFHFKLKKNVVLSKLEKELTCAFKAAYLLPLTDLAEGRGALCTGCVEAIFDFQSDILKSGFKALNHLIPYLKCVPDHFINLYCPTYKA